MSTSSSKQAAEEHVSLSVGETRSADGVRLHYCVSGPGPHEAAALVIIVHGFAEYGARYERLMLALAEAGIRSVAVDLRGHGRSGGPRGQLRSFDDYVSDVEAACEVLVQGSAAPLVVFGHSLGGPVAVLYALRHQAAMSGLALSAPFFALGTATPRWAGRLLLWLGEKTPALTVPSLLTGRLLTRDPELAAHRDRDPLILRRSNAGLFGEWTRAAEAVSRRAAELTVPMLVMAGDADTIVGLDKIREIFTAVGSEQKAFHTWPGMRHEILNAIGAEGVGQRLVGFVLGGADKQTAAVS
jgi:alpha-beta hydrolase superfamily lysophospholipase